MVDNYGNESNETSHDSALVRKSRRTLVILLVLIVILVAALGALGFLGYTLYMEAASSSVTTVKPPNDIPDDQIDDMGAPKTLEFKKTSIPNLAGLFMLDISEVEVKLGPGFTLTKTDSIEDSSNPNIKQLATISYTPELLNDTEDEVSTALLPSETIYASLNEEGKVIDIYFVCDMRLLDYPESSFDDLLSTDWTILDALSSAGIIPLDFRYELPVFENCIVYDNPNSENRKVIKQSQIFSGRIASEKIPTAWTLTVTYDFGSGVTSPDEFKQATRTINLKLA